MALAPGVRPLPDELTHFPGTREQRPFQAVHAYRVEDDPIVEGWARNGPLT